MTVPAFPQGLLATLRLKKLMSVRTFLKLAVPRHAITNVPLATHPSAHCTQRFPFVTPGAFCRLCMAFKMHHYVSPQGVNTISRGQSCGG